MAIKLEVSNSVTDLIIQFISADYDLKLSFPFSQALYTAWTNGALTLQYLQIFLQSSRKKIDEAEQTLASPPWRAVWDRLVPF